MSHFAKVLDRVSAICVAIVLWAGCCGAAFAQDSDARIRLLEEKLIQSSPGSLPAVSYSVRDIGRVAGAVRLALPEGGGHALVLTATGRVWAWGENPSGQLGVGDTTVHAKWLAVPELDSVVAIAAGTGHSVALRNDGSVWTWGANDYGQAGDGSLWARYRPERVESLRDVVAVAAGARYTLALRQDGTVWVWGSNWTGAAPGVEEKTLFAPVEVRGLGKIEAIWVRGDRPYARDAEGRQWTWGTPEAGLSPVDPPMEPETTTRASWPGLLGRDRVVRVVVGSLEMQEKGKTAAQVKLGGSVVDLQPGWAVGWIEDVAVTGEGTVGGPAAYALASEGSVSQREAGAAAAPAGSLTASAAALNPTNVGVFRSGLWSVDVNGNGVFDPGVDKSFDWGYPGATRIQGDWNGDGKQKAGFYIDGVWYLDYNGDGVWDNGVVDKVYGFGMAGAQPFVGDWNGDGRDKIGIYINGFWFLDVNGSGVWDGEPADKMIIWGFAGSTPITGDWNGDGRKKVGLFYDGLWYLDYNGDGVWDGGTTDKVYGFGMSGVQAMVGDWNGDGKEEIGIYIGGFWFLDMNGNGLWDGEATDRMTILGWAGTTPVVGDWNGDGRTKMGTFINGYWYLDYDGNGVWDGGSTDKAYVFGQAGDTPVVGKWTVSATGPATITQTGGSGQSVVVSTAFPTQLQATVTDANSNPLQGVEVLFTAPGSGASLTFQGGTNTILVSTNSAGVATAPVATANTISGSYNVVATIPAAPGVGGANFAMTNSPVPPVGALSVANVNVGRNLRAATVVSLSAVVQSDVTVTLERSNSNVTFSATGAASIQFSIPAGQLTVTVYLDGGASTGSTTLTATATNYTSGTGTATCFPSGFVIKGPNPISAGQSFSAFINAFTTITVFSARLTPAGAFAETQPLMPLFAPAGPLSITTTAGGVVNPTSVYFGAGDPSAVTSFQGTALGNTTITVQPITGFSSVTDTTNRVTATILPSGISLSPVTVGMNLEQPTVIGFDGVAGDTTVTITTNDNTKFQLSATPVGAGQDSITLNVPANASSTPEFYIYGRASSGTASFTVTSPVFGSAQGTVTLAPAGFVFATAFGTAPNPILTTPAASPTEVNVYSGRLAGNGDLLQFQAVAGDRATTVEVMITGSLGVGSITPGSVNFPGGSGTGITHFTPIAAGGTAIGVGMPVAPAGYSMPSTAYRTINVNVTTPGIACSVDDGAPIGKDLQVSNTCVLGQPVPAGGVGFLVSAAGPLLVAKAPGDVGTTSITVNVVAGASTFSFYLQATANLGVETYSVTQANYNSRSGTVTLVPSSVVLSLNGANYGLVPQGGTKVVDVLTAAIDPSFGTFLEPQILRGGLTFNNVQITSTSPANVAIDSPVNLIGGSLTPVTTTVRGLQQSTAFPGNAITVAQPAGFNICTSAPPSDFNPSSTIYVGVTAP